MLIKKLTAKPVGPVKEAAPSKPEVFNKLVIIPDP